MGRGGGNGRGVGGLRFASGGHAPRPSEAEDGRGGGGRGLTSPLPVTSRIMLADIGGNEKKRIRERKSVQA